MLGIDLCLYNLMSVFQILLVPDTAELTVISLPCGIYHPILFAPSEMSVQQYPVEEAMDEMSEQLDWFQPVASSHGLLRVTELFFPVLFTQTLSTGCMFRQHLAWWILILSQALRNVYVRIIHISWLWLFLTTNSETYVFIERKEFKDSHSIRRKHN